MHQKYVKNASEMRQNGSSSVGKRGTFQNASKRSQNRSSFIGKRGTPLGENTFWTIPKNLNQARKSGKKKKTININVLWAGQCPGQTGTVPGTNWTPPWDKLGPVPGTNRPFSV